MVHQIKILQIWTFPGCSPFSADPVTQTSLSQSCRQKMVQEVKVVTMVAFISLCFLASEHFSALMFSLIVIKRLKSPPLTYLCRHRVAGSWIGQPAQWGFSLTTVLESPGYRTHILTFHRFIHSPRRMKWAIDQNPNMQPLFNDSCSSYDWRRTYSRCSVHIHV